MTLFHQYSAEICIVGKKKKQNLNVHKAKYLEVAHKEWYLKM